jgi:hypothetical protein
MKILWFSARACLGGLLFLEAARSLVSAGLVLVEGTFTVTEGVRSELAGQVSPGDTFRFSFAYEDTATESSGIFNGAVVAGGTFQKLSGPGSWNPGAGSLTAGNVITDNNVVNLFGTPGTRDGLSFYPRAAGFANAGDYPFGQIYVPLQSTNLSNVIDGLTLGQQLGGRPAGSLPWLSGPASLDFIQQGGPIPGLLFQAAPGIVSLTVIPEPSAGLLALAGMAVAMRRRRWEPSSLTVLSSAGRPLWWLLRRCCFPASRRRPFLQ